MRVLLDSHVLLWWLEDSSRLKPAVRAILKSRDNLFYVSAATMWEISLKESLGKISVPKNFLRIVLEEGFLPLPISLEHALASGKLPRVHSDPFDRLLIAQASLEKMTFLTHDKTLKKYPGDIVVI